MCFLFKRYFSIDSKNRIYNIIISIILQPLQLEKNLVFYSIKSNTISIWTILLVRFENPSLWVIVSLHKIWVSGTNVETTLGLSNLQKNPDSEKVRTRYSFFLVLWAGHAQFVIICNLLWGFNFLYLNQPEIVCWSMILSSNDKWVKRPLCEHTFKK